MFRPTKASQAAVDRQTYIPPDIEKAMGAHMDRTLPEHLKQYQGDGTYIPQRVEKEMAKHLQKSLPGHMKQYAGAYMQQQVIRPSMTTPGPNPGSTVSPPTPTPHAPTTHFSPQPDPPPPQGPLKDYAPAAGLVDENRTAPDQPYNFITNPEPPAKQPVSAMIPGGKSPVVRALIVFAGLIVLVIIFGVFKSLLSGGANLTPFVGLAQDQQELIHLAANASQQPNLTTGDQNLAATMQLSLATSQANTINYLAVNHKKVNEKLLDLKISAATDSQLTAAAAATTYDQTFQQVVQAKLTAYGAALQQAYNLDKGKKGRALLIDSYHQAQLLQAQLTAATTPTD